LNSIEVKVASGAGRWLYKPDFAVITLPEDFYKREPWVTYASRAGLARDYLHNLATNRKRSLERGSFKDILSKRALLNWARTGLYSGYQSVPFSHQALDFRVDQQLRRDHLTSVINILSNHRYKYKIGLVEDVSAVDDLTTDPLWIVA